MKKNELARPVLSLSLTALTMQNDGKMAKNKKNNLFLEFFFIHCTLYKTNICH